MTSTIVPNGNPNLVLLVAWNHAEAGENSEEYPIVAWRIDGDEVTPICFGAPALDDDEARSYAVFDRASQLGVMAEDGNVHTREACFAELHSATKKRQRARGPK